ncbi:MAG TPA: hypothetical protein V6C65_37915, partial [Allocoleopsis sp.]
LFFPYLPTACEKFGVKQPERSIDIHYFVLYIVSIIKQSATSAVCRDDLKSISKTSSLIQQVPHLIQHLTPIKEGDLPLKKHLIAT